MIEIKFENQIYQKDF
jgi:hypothetical protein